VWQLVSGQDETYSDIKYDVSIGENHKHSKLNSKANQSKLNSKVSLGDFTNERRDKW